MIARYDLLMPMKDLQKRFGLDSFDYVDNFDDLYSCFDDNIDLILVFYPC